MLEGLFLQFSVSHFCFTHTGRKEIREKEKGNQKRKVASQLVDRQMGQRLPDHGPGCFAI
jgi:hypothetical protein